MSTLEIEITRTDTSTLRRLFRAPAARTAGYLGLVCAALYSYFFLEFALGRLDMPTSFVSELSARDQPWHRLYESFDIISGLMMVVIAFALARVLPAGRVATWGWISFAAFGVSTTLVGSLPMDCAPSMTTACALAEAEGRVSWMHWGHEVFSVTATAGLVASMFLLGFRLRRVPGWQPAGRYVAVALPAIVLLCVPLVLLGLGFGVDTTDTPTWSIHQYFGIYERIQINLAVGWIAVVGLTLLRLARTVRREGVDLAA